MIRKMKIVFSIALIHWNVEICVNALLPMNSIPILQQRHVAFSHHTSPMNVNLPHSSVSCLRLRRRGKFCLSPTLTTELKDSLDGNPIGFNDKNVLHKESSVNLENDSNIGCEHFGFCPGCSVMERVDEVDVIGSARLYFDSLTRRKLTGPFQTRPSGKLGQMNDGQFEFKVVIPTKSVRRWRSQAKLVVAASTSKNHWSKSTKTAGCVFGLYQRNSHSIVSIPRCQVHHPSINLAVQALELATAKVQTPACFEEANISTGSATTTTLTNLRPGLRYVQLQVERTTGKICLSLVWFARDVKETQPSLSRLTKELVKSHPQLWHSIWLHFHDSLGNNIFSRSPQSSWDLLFGPELMREPLPRVENLSQSFLEVDSERTRSSKSDGPWLYFTPQTFRQANLDGFEMLANQVARTVPPGATVCELYAGVGVLGLTALYYHALQSTPLAWLRCSDENPSNSRCFRRAVLSFPESVSEIGSGKLRQTSKSRQATTDRQLNTVSRFKRKKAGQQSAIRSQAQNEGMKTSYLVASAGAALLAGQALGASVLIVDPPRKGLDEDVLAELCKPINPDQDDSWESSTLLPLPDEKVNWVNSVKMLLYVSCGFEALTRDCDRLLSNRGAGWRLESAIGYVLFPGTDHVETLCVFRRN